MFVFLNEHDVLITDKKFHHCGLIIIQVFYVQLSFRNIVTVSFIDVIDVQSPQAQTAHDLWC